MADSSASCYCTSGRGQSDIIFTDINISDDYYYKLKRGGVILLLSNYRLCCLGSRAASSEGSVGGGALTLAGAAGVAVEFST